MKTSLSKIRPAGYAYMIDKLNLNTMPNWHISYVSIAGGHRSEVKDGFIEDIYPKKYWPGESIGDHLEFALKYDGVNLNCLALIFNAVQEENIINYVQSKPTGKYARRLWFFYEFLTEKILPIKNLTKGNYVEALDAHRYYGVVPGKRIQRQRILNNLLGDKNFSPIVRRTEKLKIKEADNLHSRCEIIVASYPPQLLKRALNYLYKKETKSSFEIEHVRPDASRAEKFIALLKLAEHQDFCAKERLLDLQNKTVDPRFKDIDYRKKQNYVGQTASYQKEMMHYICPKPEDLPDLMQGLITSHTLLKAGSMPVVIHAAVIAYGFVFLHPFEDGNGRIHRFLIHNILSIQGLVPKGLMFPVSAVMVKNLEAYDNSLEAFSHPLMQLIDFSLDEIGEMIVHNDTAGWYQYIDMTSQAEALYDFVSQTIENELISELNFLINYDQTKKALQNIIDMPDRLIDLFVQFCLQNSGRLSVKKRAAHFDFLTDDELSLMEKTVKNGYDQLSENR